MNRRIAFVLLTALGVVLAAAAIVYAFGKPTAPAGGATSVATESEAASATPGEVPKADPASPLAIEIPGCVCHSDDPKLVKEHESYRMNQCAGCHAGGVPTGQ